MKLTKFVTALLSAVLSMLNATCFAAPISYTFSGIASGSFGGAGFSDKAFLITAIGDTDALTLLDAGVLLLPLQSVHVSVDSVDSGLAVNAFGFFVNQTLSEVGLIESLYGDVLDVSSNALSAYNGIISWAATPVALDYLSIFETTSGLLSLDLASNLFFAATMDSLSVSAPPTSALILAGLLAAFVVRPRPRQQ